MHFFQITSALNTFGISDKDERIIVAHIHDTIPDGIPDGTKENARSKSDDETHASMREICDRVVGERIPLSRLSEFSDTPLIRKVGLQD